METNRQKEAVKQARRKRASVKSYLLTGFLAVVAIISAAIVISSCFGSGILSEDALFRTLGLRESRCGESEGCFAFYNVGNGDCSAVYTNRAIGLIDTGNAEYAPALLQKLQALSVKSLDFIVISHPHDDHAGGYAYLLEHLPVRNVYIGKYDPSDFEDYDYYLELLALSNKYNVQIVHPVDRMQVSADTITINFYCPSFYAADENDRSLVTMVSIGKKRCLYTGDSGVLTEDVLLSRGYDVNADLLKLGHHGSKTATSEAFLTAVAPSYAVACVGYNTYGHPSDIVTELLAKKKIPLYRTDGYNSVSFSVNNESLNPTVQ